MPKKPYRKYHADGTLWARGFLLNGKETGKFTWYRKDGTKLRSGSFLHGKQVGDWTTYDQAGRVYKVTRMKPRQE